MPAAVKALFARKLLKKVAEAYGRMLLIKGLFQADCHPGNILIRDDNGLGRQDRNLPAICVLYAVLWYLDSATVVRRIETPHTVSVCCTREAGAIARTVCTSSHDEILC